MKTPVRHQYIVIKIILIFVCLALISGTGLSVYRQTSHINSVLAATEQDTEDTLKEIAAQALLEAKKKEPVYITLTNADPIRAIVEDYTEQQSLWVLVNKTHSISTSYVPQQLALPDVPERTDKTVEERSVRGDIVAPLESMFDAAAKDGHSLMIGSAYRSATLQKLYFDTYAANSGIVAANQYSAFPGQSEHQTGLAVDISSVSRSCYLDACFTSTPDGQWLAANGYKYGFTLRYPEGKTAITGYNFEPWHYRYVGIDLATALYQSNLTVDEAWPSLLAALNTLKENGALSR
jgi:D-alanyl-D-alanine carboxypeptidase